MSIYLISLSLLIAAVIAVRAIFRRSMPQRVIYALWLVVLLRICLPFQVFAVEMPTFLTYDDIETEVTELPETTHVPDISIIPSESVTVPSVTVPTPSVTVPDVSVTVPVTEPTTSAVPDITPPTTSAVPDVTEPSIVTPPTKDEINIPWAKVLYTVWATGSIIFALIFSVSALDLSRKLRYDREYYMNLGRTKVYRSKNAQSPMVWGLIPAIYVTPDSRGSEPYSLIHELTHLRHGDHIWSVVRAAVLVAFWWNPLIWAAVILSKQDAELACDEAIASRLDGDARIEYANVIVDNIPRRGTLAVGLASAPIKERIIMITRKNKTRVLSLILALVLTLGAVGCSFIGPKEPTPPDTIPTTDDAVAKLDEKLNKKYTQYMSNIGSDNTLLVSYIGDDKEPLLYGTNDGENFNKVDIEIPEKYPYDNAEVAYIYPDKVMVELVYKGVYTYIEFVFDNDEPFDGVLSADECYFVDYLTSPLSFMKMPCTNFPDTKEDGIGPFAAYVESDTADSIDVYTSEGGEKIASIPWNVIADFPATEKRAGWLPYKIWYSENDGFVWAVVAGGVHLGSDNRNFCISRDGGATWEIGEFAATWSGITTSAIFLSDKIGLMGYERGAYDGIVIARTDDGGKSWNRVDIEIPTGLADFRGTTPISFKYDGNTLTRTVALKEGVGPDTGVDILSKDGGVSWEYEYNWSEKVGTYHTVISNTGTREAHLIPAAMYGYRMGDGIAYTSFEKNTQSYWTTLNAGSDTEFYAVFGMQNDYKAQGDFDGYTTYHVTAKNGRVMKTELVATMTKEVVLTLGKPYSGELKGTYMAKSFSRGDGLTSYTFLFNNGNIELSAYRAGSGAGLDYSGTYTYDKESGRLDIRVTYPYTENEKTYFSGLQTLTCKVYEYDGFIHLIPTDNGLSMVEIRDPLPITFKMEEGPTDFDMMSSIIINGSLTEKQLAGEAINDEIMRSFIGLSCVSHYRENGFIYSAYWRLINNNMTWYLSADDAARIAYEVFGVENYNGGEIKIPNGVGVSSGNSWIASDVSVSQMGDRVVYDCTLIGDDMNESPEKVFGNYRFTFKYITEGDRGFWRYVGVEETEHLYTKTVDAYDCQEIYFDHLTETYGKYRVSMPIDTEKYDVSYQVRYCDDMCAANDIENFYLRIVTGAAPVFNCVQSYTKRTTDGYNFATHRFEWSIPEMMKSGMTEESIRETEGGLANMYEYLLELGGGYYLGVMIEPKNANTSDAANEIETAIKNVTAARISDPDNTEIAIKKALSAARSVGNHLRYNPTAAQVSSSDKIEVNGLTYYRVIPTERFPYDTWDGMIEYLEQFFSPALTARLLAETGRFAERDGILYQSISEGYRDNSLHSSTLEIIKESDRKYIARETTKVVDINDRTKVTGEVTFDYPFEYIHGSWVFTDLPKRTSRPGEYTYYPISEHYGAYLTRDMRTVHIRKTGESENLLSISCDSGEGLQHAAFLPGSTIFTLSEDEKTLVVNYISNIDQRREGATLYDLEAKQVRSHYLPTPEEIIKVNDPTGELAKKFQAYLESGQYQIVCKAKPDDLYVELTYELVADDMMFRASERVSRDSYYGGLKYGLAVSDMTACTFREDFERAKELSSWFYHTSNLYEYDGTEKLTEWHGYAYLPATNPILAQNNITDIPTLKAYFETVFTKAIVDYFMVMCTDEENVSKSIAIPYIAHFDGKLWGYYSVAGNRYGMPELCAFEQSADRVTLLYKLYDTAAENLAASVREYKVRFLKVDGKWLCDNYLIF